MFLNAENFNQALCSWAEDIFKLVLWHDNESMFSGTNCPFTDLNRATICHKCCTLGNVAFNDGNFKAAISQWHSDQILAEYFVFNGPIELWNTKDVTDMSNLFSGTNFNGDIGCWDTSSVTTMRVRNILFLILSNLNFVLM